MALTVSGGDIAAFSSLESLAGAVNYSTGVEMRSFWCSSTPSYQHRFFQHYLSVSLAGNAASSRHEG